MMRHLTLAAASILLLAACTHSPTGPTPTYSYPYGTLELNIGPKATTILNAPTGSDIPAIVAQFYCEQQAIDFEGLVDDTVNLVIERNPEIIEIAQTRILPAINVSLGRQAPSPVECPEFAPLLWEALQTGGRSFIVSEHMDTVNIPLTMSVEGSADVEVRLVVTESRFTRPAGIIK